MVPLCIADRRSCFAPSFDDDDVEGATEAGASDLSISESSRYAHASGKKDRGGKGRAGRGTQTGISCRLFPFNRAGRLGTDVVDDAVDATHVVDDPR